MDSKDLVGWTIMHIKEISGEGLQIWLWKQTEAFVPQRKIVQIDENSLHEGVVMRELRYGS